MIGFSTPEGYVVLIGRRLDLRNADRFMINLEADHEYMNERHENLDEDMQKIDERRSVPDDDMYKHGDNPEELDKVHENLEGSLFLLEENPWRPDGNHVFFKAGYAKLGGRVYGLNAIWTKLKAKQGKLNAG